jgi:hypothetical protein
MIRTKFLLRSTYNSYGTKSVDSSENGYRILLKVSPVPLYRILLDPMVVFIDTGDKKISQTA